MTDSPFQPPSPPDETPVAADPGEGAPGRGENLAEHLAEDTAGERPEDGGDDVDLADELRGRADPPFRTPNPRGAS